MQREMSAAIILTQVVENIKKNCLDYFVENSIAYKMGELVFLIIFWLKQNIINLSMSTIITIIIKSLVKLFIFIVKV